MVENRPWLTVFAHAMLVAGILVIAFPLYVTFVASTRTLDDILSVPMPLIPGDQLWENYTQVLFAGTTKGVTAPVGRMMFNSLVMALAIALGKIAISIIASFAIVFFRFPLRNFFFWMIFVTLMLPVEVRIIPTFKVVSDLGMINSYVGLTLPLIASATATFLFRQFFLTVPVAASDHHRRGDVHLGDRHQAHDQHRRRAHRVEPGDGDRDARAPAACAGGASDAALVRERPRGD
jgi:sn-glycerol 3-phosphate transport system permease protein